ncbi:RdgB/HAM1 family non-canonical purine NTP pyrophosphatase [bacterium]|nr:RdgB/HAM1 family non-canonical purine NTP pyrophosphatase [bacterium]
MKKLILATRNSDKIIEIQSIMKLDHSELAGIGNFPQAPDVVEDGQTLRENALKKARSAFLATGLPSVADDSGLEVDALDGAPGVHSSRFAGEHVTYADNNAKLLSLMQGVPESRRTARFRCVACYVDKTHEEYVEGVCEGVILEELRGNQGFGYDPLFFIPRLGKTLAELSVEAKSTLSHRGEAFRRMGEMLKRMGY